MVRSLLWTNMVGKMRDKLYNANKIDRRYTRKRQMHNSNSVVFQAINCPLFYRIFIVRDRFISSLKCFHIYWQFLCDGIDPELFCYVVVFFTHNSVLLIETLRVTEWIGRRKKHFLTFPFIFWIPMIFSNLNCFKDEVLG